MRVFRYGLRFRPPQLGAVPRGFIPDPSMTRNVPDYSQEFRFGFLDYPKKLTPEDERSYELTFVGEHDREVPCIFYRGKLCQNCHEVAPGEHRRDCEEEAGDYERY